MAEHHRTSARTIVFDGDDTLWETQTLYDDAKRRFFALLESLGVAAELSEREFAEIDVANVGRLGFSPERFPMSMRQTYEHFCRIRGQVPDATVCANAEAIGRTVFETEPTVRPDALCAINQLGTSYSLFLFTAGDPCVQERRIAQTGLRAHFDGVWITPQKSLATWQSLIETQAIDPMLSWSIGNSMRSDINPALRLGLRCVVVAGRSWEYERVSLAPTESVGRTWHAASLTEAARIILNVETEIATSSRTESRTGTPAELLVAELRTLRERLEPVFAQDTALPGTPPSIPSAGHCAAVAAVVQQRFGGGLVSAYLEGEPHWFNRLATDATVWDVDLTGDQFGFPAVQVAKSGDLYPRTTPRDVCELEPETIERAARLATRASFVDIARALRRRGGMRRA